MDGLSDTAKAFLGSLWVNPRFGLRYAMVENVPSEQAQAALDELYEAGILARKREPGGAITYVLTDRGVSMNRKPKGGMAFLKKHGSFPLSVPRPQPSTKDPQP